MKNYTFTPKRGANFFLVVKNTPQNRQIVKRANKALRDSNMKIVPYGRGPQSLRRRGYALDYCFDAPLSRAPLLALYLYGADGSYNWDGRENWNMIRLPQVNCPTIVYGIRLMIPSETIVLIS